MNRAEAYDHERKALKRPVPENKALPGPPENKNESQEGTMGQKWVGRGDRRRLVDDTPPTDFASSAAEALATEHKLTPADFEGYARTSENGYTKADVQYVVDQKAAKAGAQSE